MILRVDYNRKDARGFIPATLRGSQAWQVQTGSIVLAEDGEGTCAKAHVEELRRSAEGGTAVAYLSLIPGTVEPNTNFDWIVEAQDEYIEYGDDPVAL